MNTDNSLMSSKIYASQKSALYDNYGHWLPKSKSWLLLLKCAILCFVYKQKSIAKFVNISIRK